MTETNENNEKRLVTLKKKKKSKTKPETFFRRVWVIVYL